MTDAIQKAREALVAARDTLSAASRQLTDYHKIVLGGKRWGEVTSAKIASALAALDAETEVNAEEIKGRAASVLCEAGALCGWPAPNCNAREGAEALFKAGLLALVTPESRS